MTIESKLEQIERALGIPPIFNGSVEDRLDQIAQVVDGNVIAQQQEFSVLEYELGLRNEGKPAAERVKAVRHLIMHRLLSKSREALRSQIAEQRREIFRLSEENTALRKGLVTPTVDATKLLIDPIRLAIETYDNAVKQAMRQVKPE